MKTRLIAAFVATILVVGISTPSIAMTPSGDPVGTCPTPFQLQPAHDHNDEADYPHKHVGTDTDKNGDGWICVKHVGKGDKIHVHTDNNLPL